MAGKIRKPPVGARAIPFDLKRRVMKYMTVRKLRQQGAPTFPPLIDLEVTNHCNLNCVMCPRDTMKRPKGYMEFDFFREVIDQIPPHRLEKSWLHLYGEPLLHPKLPDMIRYAKEKVEIEQIGISTNCVLLDEEKAESLLSSPLDMLVLSVDGATQETYEKIRRKGAFDKVVENVARFIEMRKERGSSRPTVWVQIIEMQDNFDEIERFKSEWAPRLGPEDQVFVKNFSAFGGRIGDRADFYKHMPRTRLPCSYLWSYFVVYWDGRVTPCCLDMEGELCIGDLKRSSIQEIWSSPKLAEFQEIHLRDAYSEMPLCGKCWGH